MTDMDYVRIAVASVRRYQGNADWEDIRQEAILGALVNARRCAASGRAAPGSAAHIAARRAVIDYLYPCRQWKTTPPIVISYEAMMEGEQREGGAPMVPDPSLAIVERMGALTLLQQCASRDEYEVARRVLLGGQEQRTAAREMGVAISTVSARLCDLRRKLRQHAARFDLWHVKERDWGDVFLASLRATGNAAAAARAAGVEKKTPHRRRKQEAAFAAAWADALKQARENME